MKLILLQKWSDCLREKTILIRGPANIFSTNPSSTALLWLNPQLQNVAAQLDAA